ncbi:hypothetical protein K4K60_004554 [Colletotrichum sp. SAR11_57]|nr:hypothetical protein K4K60_004554 [Colletotrichum sp. SAR11_57]
MRPVDDTIYAIGAERKGESHRVYAVKRVCQNNGVYDLRFGSRGSGAGGEDNLMFLSPGEPLTREQTRYLRKLVGREMELSEDASFECVVRYKDFIEEFGDRKQAIRQNTTLPCALVMNKLEFEWSGLLADDILRKLQDTDIVNVAVDMLSALTYLHALGIVHGDVRPQNVVPYRNTTQPHGDWHRQHRYRLSGHGLVPAIFSKWAESPGEMYTAPEFAGRGRYKPTRESDVWMLGTMLQELHESRYKRIPQPISAYSEFLTRKGACEYPAMRVWHDWLEALVAKLLQDKPGDRPRAEDALTGLLEEKFRATEGGQVGAEKREMKETIKKAKAERWRATTMGKHYPRFTLKMTPTYHNLAGVPDQAGRANRYTTTGLKRDGYQKNVYELHDGHQLNAEQGQSNLMFIKFVGNSPEEKSELERFAKEEVSLGEDTAFELVVRYKDYIEKKDMLVVEEANWKGIEPRTYISDEELMVLAVDVLSALTYLHDRHQVHGYVHPSNIIRFKRPATEHGDELWGYKLIGHGLVPKVMWTWNDIPGDQFTPPEFHGKKSEYQPSEEGDVWMLGQTLAELHSRAGGCDKHRHGQLHDLLKKMLKPTPGERMKAQVALDTIVGE